MVEHELHGFGVEVQNAFHGSVQKLVVFLAEFVQKVLYQARDILPAVPQRGQIDIDDIQAVVEIFAEFLLFHHLAQIRVGGRQDTNIHLDHFVGAERGEFLLLNNSQQFGLRLGADGAHFIEENSALVGDFKRAFPGVNRAGEGTLHVPEQGGFQQITRQGAAVYGDESMVHPRRIGVDGLGHQFFAGAGFAGHQNGRAAGGHLSDKVKHPQHTLTLAHDIGEAVALLERALELGVFVQQALAGNDPVDFDQQFVIVPGFGQIIVGTQFYGLHGRFHGTESRDHENGCIAVPFANVPQHFHAGFFRHHEVQQHQVVGALLQLAFALGGILGEVYFITFQVQQCFQTFADLNFIVNNENAAPGPSGGSLVPRKNHACTALCSGGNSRWKQVPSPGLESASIAPPCS